MEKGDVTSFNPVTTEILLLTDGIVEVDDEHTVVKLRDGLPAAAVFPGDTIYLAAATKSTVFRASATTS